MPSASLYVLRSARSPCHDARNRLDCTSALDSPCLQGNIGRAKILTKARAANGLPIVFPRVGRT
eukprot:1870952-Pyramimonas_sp.AAC.1